LESLLIFAEHRLFLNEPPSITIARLHRSQPEKKVIVVLDLQPAALLSSRSPGKMS